VIAALLHDAVEDTWRLARLHDIDANFGKEVARIVEGCSDSSGVFCSPFVPRLFLELLPVDDRCHCVRRGTGLRTPVLFDATQYFAERCSSWRSRDVLSVFVSSSDAAKESMEVWKNQPVK
jgi:hypothetical protein